METLKIVRKIFGFLSLISMLSFLFLLLIGVVPGPDFQWYVLMLVFPVMLMQNLSGLAVFMFMLAEPVKATDSTRGNILFLASTAIYIFSIIMVDPGWFQALFSQTTSLAAVFGWVFIMNPISALLDWAMVVASKKHVDS